MHNYRMLFFFNAWFSMQATHYEILQIPFTAIQKEIRAAYLQQVKKVHPDKNNNQDAVRMFQSLGNAYTTLKDPELRRLYDASLQHEEHEYITPKTCKGCACMHTTLSVFFSFFIHSR